MKKHILKLIAVLIFTSATVTGFSGCTVEYREHHEHHWDHDHGHDHDEHDHDYRNYR